MNNVKKNPAKPGLEIFTFIVNMSGFLQDSVFENIGNVTLVKKIQRGLGGNLA